MLNNAVNENELITAHKVESSDMYNFLNWQYLYYRSPKCDAFNTTYIFQSSGTSYGLTHTYF